MLKQEAVETFTAEWRDVLQDAPENSGLEEAIDVVGN
jgi:hypothetical protein